ncbi:MAG: protein kinase [Bacteroides sp.]|nr:protein kinase [Bacteroides sp.]MCM1414118.1 protein kinase [Bacteroides sp.]MCM1472382.1 protein kinase [Bacteroides sp.]
MNKDDDISGFGNFGTGGDATVDFARATRLKRSGSTCDAYVTTLQRRRVFIKRLKPEFRDNPQYRAAFDKEFDLGVSLTHPSLPRYIALHDDYIVMDYMEGDTLADLIARKDDRLDDQTRVHDILLQLIDAIDYLHHRNVVHCDVKADNVIISPYADRPATLIDLDKAYTSWLDDTSGNPGKYGCTDCADGAIDFRGLGRIAESLGEQPLAEACMSDGVTADRLRAILKPAQSHSPSNVLRGLLYFILGIVIILAGYFIFRPRQEKPHPVAPTEEPVIDSVIEPQPESTVATPSTITVATKPTIDDGWIADMIRQKTSALKTDYQATIGILDNDSIPIQTAADAFSDYIARSGSIKTDIIFTAVSHYRALPELDVQNAVRSHPRWIKFEQEETTLLEKYSQRISHP